MNNEEKILSMLEHLTTGVSGLRADVTELKSDVAVLKQDVTELKADVAILKETVAEHSERLDELDARSLRSAVLLETEVARDIHLIYEGQKALLEKMGTYATSERVDGLEGEVTVLKGAMQITRQEIAELKGA
ncbi:MAG: hypothetical protein K2O84_11225 [Oscillospiraceae bacterium]|jgi:peptidoglycan hydrolase CwlO-like protein|nr:hypothetical protein [Oscillospiraceae bacterium]